MPTLIARDGAHPSHPSRYQDDNSASALRCCGYGLRNYLTLMRYDEVIRAVLRIENCVLQNIWPRAVKGVLKGGGPGAPPPVCRCRFRASSGGRKRSLVLSNG